MEHTFSQIYIHIVFSVKNRERLISRTWKEELYKYISGIITNEGQKLYIINGDMDHIHMLIGMYPNKSISDLVRAIKANSSAFIKEKRFTGGSFNWQRGFAAFSIGKSEVKRLIHYINIQEQHHGGKTFAEEYETFLDKYGIEFDRKYLFKE